VRGASGTRAEVWDPPKAIMAGPAGHCGEAHISALKDVISYQQAIPAPSVYGRTGNAFGTFFPDNLHHLNDCDCLDCRCCREGFRQWNLNLDGADIAARHYVRIRGRDGCVLPPGWGGEVEEGLKHPDLPKWIRIGHERYKYNFKMVHAKPLVYRGIRSSDDRWSQPDACEVLWLFRKWGRWVCGHADKDEKSMKRILGSCRLVWSTDAYLPVAPGAFALYWVDNDKSRTANAMISPWLCGTFATHEIEHPPGVRRETLAS
jgi:hypothetical protein